MILFILGTVTGIFLHVLFLAWLDKQGGELSFSEIMDVLDKTRPGYLEIFLDEGDIYLKMEDLSGFTWTDRLELEKGRARISLHPPPLLLKESKKLNPET